MLWRHKAHSDGLSLVVDCDVHMGMDCESDVVTDGDASFEGSEAKEASVKTYWSSRLSPVYVATIWVVKMNVAVLGVLGQSVVMGKLPAGVRACSLCSS